jgi:DNA replication protein
MKSFIGFTHDKQRAVRVPEGFFSDLLPQITSMLEMKVTLFLFWRLARSPRDEGAPRMVSLAELDMDEDLRAAIARAKGPRPHGEALREGLELCVARGTLLQLRVRNDEGDEHVEANGHVDINEEYWYILNTRENRAWIGAVASGEIDVLQTPLAHGHVEVPQNGNGKGHGPPRLRVIAERPNIFALYEQNIGLLTPLIAEQLQEAERRYPREWVEMAFLEAVSNNKRSWRYIERILDRWSAEGKAGGKDRGPDGRSFDPDKYTKGKYAFLFQPE